VDLLLGTDDQIAERHDTLQLRGHPLVRDEAVLAIVPRGETPEDRPIVDVEHQPAARRLDRFGRLHAGGEHIGPRQMRAVDQQRAGGGDMVRVDIVRAQRHVGAILAVEDQGKAFRAADAEDRERGQPFGIIDHPLGIDAFAHQLLADETPENDRRRPA
jgi:hypothetical protein